MCKMKEVNIVDEYFRNKKAIQIIVQTTLDCNLRCKHCYESNNNYPKQNISFSVIEKIIKLAQNTYDRVDYLWFGGEPLLSGVEFFKKIVLLQKKYGKNNCAINNTVQTNGCLINDEFALFFKDNNFDVSISYDAQFNDDLRQETEKTIKAIDLCKEYNIHVTTISTITSKNCGQQFEMYKFLQEKQLLGKFNRIFAEGNAKNNDTYLIDNENYVNSMKLFFDKWLYDTNSSKTSSIDICLNSLFNIGAKECVYNGCLFKWLAFAPNGEVYPCPRFVGSKYKLGNIEDYKSVNDIFLSAQYEELMKNSLLRAENCKAKCKLFPFCHSGCNARSYWGKGLQFPSDDICYYVKNFFPYMIKTISALIDSNSIEKTNRYFQNLYKHNENNFKATCLYFKENNLI